MFGGRKALFREIVIDIFTGLLSHASMTSRWTETLDTAVFWALCAVVALAPLPLGSNRLWSASLIGVVLALLLVVWLARLAFGGDLYLPRALVVPSLLFAAVLAVVVVQGVCWDGPFAHPTWSLAPGLDATACPRVTLDPYRTWTGFTHLLMYGVAFWLALQLCRSSRRAGHLLVMFAVTTTLYAGYGLITYFAEVRPGLFFEERPFHHVLTSTFVNRNSFAVFAGMGVVANLALLADRLLAGQQADRRLRLWVLAESLSRLPFYLLGFVVCLIAIILSQSRAGFAVTMIGIVVLVLSFALHHRLRLRKRLAGGAVPTILGLVMLVTGGGALMSRYANLEGDLEYRGIAIIATLEATGERPWLGVGFGTFEDAWPAFRPEEVRHWFRQAHSTYAENLFELGVPAALALFVAFGCLLVQCARGVLRRRRHGIYPALALSAALLPVLQSITDFSLQIPAITVATMALLGRGVAQSSSTRAEPEAEHPGFKASAKAEPRD